MHIFDSNIFELDYIDVPDPAVGTNLLYPIPARSRWIILAINFIFTTSIFASARTMMMGTLIGSTLHNRFGHNQSQINGKTADYRFFSSGGTFVFSGSRNMYSAPLPSPYYIDDRSSLISLITDLNAFDQLSDIRLTVLKQIKPD